MSIFTFGSHVPLVSEIFSCEQNPLIVCALPAFLAALQASAQLNVVRESHGATCRELEEARAHVRQLKAAVQELAEQVDGAREAHALALQEFDVRLHCRKAPHIA